MSKPVDLVIRVKADTGEVAPGMKALDRELDEATKSAKALDKELGEVSDQDLKLDVNTQAIDAARRRIDDLRDDIANTKALDIDADTKKAEQEIAKLRRSIKALSDDSKDLSSGGGSIGQSMARGMDEASEGVEEFGRESASTAKETAASFDGSAESIAGAFQEVAANAFAGFGPAGLVAGLAVAAGVGFGIQALTKMSEAANKVTDDAIAMNDAFGDATDAAGRIAALQERWDEFGNTINDVRSIWELWQDRSTTNMEAFADSARLAGLDVEALNHAFTDPDPQTRLRDLNKVLDQQRDALEKVKDLQNQGHGEDVTEEQTKAWAEQKDAIEGTMKALEEEVKVSETAAELEKAAADVRGVSIERYREQVAAMEDAKAAQEEAAQAQEAYNELIAASADPVNVYTELMATNTEKMRTDAQAMADSTKESTGEAADSWQDYATDVTVTTQQMIDEWTRQAEATQKFEENLAIIGANGGQALADEMRAKGPEVAGAMAATLAAEPTPTMKAAIDAHWKAQGAAAAAAAARGIASQVDAIRNAMGITLGSASSYIPGVSTGPRPGQGMAPAPATAGAAAGNVRVYIDGNQLRATVRTDVAAASARAAFAGAGGVRP